MRVTILAAAVVAALTACGATTSDAGSDSAPPSTTATSSTGPQEPAVKVELTFQDKPGLGLLAATNEGSAPITVQGWPKLAFTNPAGEAVAIPVERKLVPGEGPPITLQPGQTAFAGVKLDEDDDTKSFAIDEMTAELPGLTPATVRFVGTDGKPVTGPGRIKVSDAEVGTLQPVAQGVLVFD
ncbi:Protein of unknown function [Lentzea fradiae]|uniref:DUF4232 domain-containing protein n=1 Tax=Lentzea fradiae TaxID=200378 RepID=A0A1G7P698_9PSEU|nr:DUF4232 domain-containing protein [Lentzea fradiae]SDF81788.1 Protein of unknown function [Lentzea fradiae]